MRARYVWAELVRNPRRTMSTVLGVTLGVGLTCAVLFFVDGLSASMSQRAVAALPIDIQRVLTDPIGQDLRLSQRLDREHVVRASDKVRVLLELRNVGALPANEVVVRSLPPAGFEYVAGTATFDGAPIADGGGNPFANGPALAGRNLGMVPAGATRAMSYTVKSSRVIEVAEASFRTLVSSREALEPIDANAPAPVSLADLAPTIASIRGVAFAEPLSFVDLAPGSLSAGRPSDAGPVRVFAFAPSYLSHDHTIRLVSGAYKPGQALLSAEAARSLGVRAADSVTVALPDRSSVDVRISGIVDLTRARSLFSSRKGADLETFVYEPTSIIVDPAQFRQTIVPAFDRVATARGERLKNPPVHEVDVGVKRNLLKAEPSAALRQTRAIGAAVARVSGHQDYVLDNISNTLSVARDDAALAKRMFLFLGIPGAMLAAMLAAYAGNVLAGSQRREQATLRIRGATRGHLLSMLAIRVGAITAVGAVVGVGLGYISAAAVVGHQTLQRATGRSLAISGVLGTAAGLLATGAALYITGRRSIDREISEDRARLTAMPPVWRRFRLDMVLVVCLAAATAVAVAKSAFDGKPGSVYNGRGVALPLSLLTLPIGAWIAGSLLGARGTSRVLRGRRGRRARTFERPLADLFRLSTSRRSWAIADGVIVVALIVALGTSLSVFTASYNDAKTADARYEVGSDLRISPSPTSNRTYQAGNAADFAVRGVDSVTPVVYGVHNVVLQSRRTSDVANLAAVDPATYGRVAPLKDGHFPGGSASKAIAIIRDDPSAIFLSAHMADFLQASVGDKLQVLLARATPAQVETDMHLVGVFERLPGFPDGADALMNISRHEDLVASTIPNFFLARTSDPSTATLASAAAALRGGPGAAGGLQIDTRTSALGKDQSSLAALNIRGLLSLDSGYALAMGIVAIAIFVFGLLMQRRREYVTLRAQGLQPRAIRILIAAEAGTVAAFGSAGGVLVGTAMAFYFVRVLRSLFVLTPRVDLVSRPVGVLVASVLAATVVTSVAASTVVNRLRATELLRDE